MTDYRIEDLRNVVLVGHGSSGKTSLSEAMLYDTGQITRLGRVEEKNTVSDYDDEEQRRGLSVNSSILPVEWAGAKINILDAPGYMDFVGEVKTSIRGADGAVLVICAASGVEVGAEVHWGFLAEEQMPRLVFINKMNRDNASFERALESVNEKFETTLVPITLPIGAEGSFQGVVDLTSMKAYLGSDNTESDIPAGMQDAAETAHMEMVEYAAEVDDELMLKYLDGEELTNDEVRQALVQGAKEGNFVLVFVGSATENMGVRQLLDGIKAYLPSPAAVERSAISKATGQEVVLEADVNGNLIAQIFKTMADPFVGKLSYFRVYNGTFASDSRVTNSNQEEEERIGQLYLVRGKEQEPVDKVIAGDIGAVAKLSVSATGDTLCDRGELYEMKRPVFPEPLFSVAVFPKTKADLDKLGSGLARLVEEDPTLRVERNTETNETILSGMGESHIHIATLRLAAKFGVQVETALPLIAYRETISRTTSAQGRHKKQSGGRGQFGDVYCRFEPAERGEGLSFESKIFGGSVPRQYVPAVEKGFYEAMVRGAIAGFPVVDIKCVLYDGSYHSVDSSELAFKLATHLAYRNAVPNAGPVLLEPVYKIEVTVPENYMGDILGDLNTRRAQVQGMEQTRGNGVVTAIVPLAEIQRYATDLRSMTQGRGMYRMEFSYYGQVPAHLVDKIKADMEKRKGEDR